MSQSPIQRLSETFECQKNTAVVEIESVSDEATISVSSRTSVDERDNRHFRDLLPQLTIAEKVSLVSGTSFTTTAAVTRLGIPQLKVSDSINGVRGSNSHLEDHGTACFPSTTCLAATWNPELLRELGEELGEQAKLRSVQIVIGPNVNMHRDPRGGRNFETFSEDPMLTGRSAAAIVNGIQSRGVGACAKHFIANDSETLRRSYNVTNSGNSRTMREIYMKSFQYMLRESNPASIMMAYNKLAGAYCSESPLIKEVLRESWGYDGCVMSDWYGTHSGIEALEAGLDLEMPGPSVFRGEKLLKSVENDPVVSKHLDEAVQNVLTMIDRTAESHSQEPEMTVICERTSSIARRLATEGLVLLKNENQALPVTMSDAPRIAIIGSAATKPVVSGGGSAQAKPQYIQTAYECLRRDHPSPSHVEYAKGVNENYTIPVAVPSALKAKNGQTGIDVEYYNDGSPTLVHAEHSPIPQVVMIGRLKPGLDRTGFHYIVTSTLTPETTGNHSIGVQVTGSYSLYVNDKEILSGPAPEITMEDFLFVPKKLERSTQIYLEAHKQYSIRIVVHSKDKFSSTGEITPHSVKLCYAEETNDRHSIATAVSLASQADISLIFSGRTHEHESEGFDMPNLTLPPSQVKMIKAVAAVSTRTILILHCGNPIDVSDFIDDVDALLIAHFPGQEGAQAITDVLTGKANPSGKLATSWPVRLDADHVPSYDNFPAVDYGNGPELTYAEGLRIGYRHPRALSMNHFQFGFGLSYSSFVFSDLHLKSDLGSETISVTVTVKNDGPRAGHEVVQVYTGAMTPLPGLWRPERELKGFAKVWLEVGESKEVTIPIRRRDVSEYWDEKGMCWRTQPGRYRFTVGELSQEIELMEEQSWTGL